MFILHAEKSKSDLALVSTIEYTIIDKLRSSRKIFYELAYYLITAVLLFSGVSKIMDINPLIDTLEEVKLPHDLIITTATLLPITEIGLGIMLLFRIEQRTALRITAILFLVFFLFSVYGMILGLEEDCGCFGSVLKSNFGLSMIIRNLVLLTSIILVLGNTKNKYN